MATAEHQFCDEEAESRPGDATGRLSRLLAELAAPPPSAAAEWEQSLQPGDRLDRFEIRGLIGRGGFGAVYDAWDSELNRAVALKTLRVARRKDDESAEAIRQEAEAVAKLNHPAIVTLYDVGLSEQGYYLVMERLEGATLAARLARGPVPWTDAVRIATELAAALAHAHARGVLHRDLKPANVFLCDDGRVKLLDFGLAHLLGSARASSGGTPAYMAPEQRRGDVVDARADVFALGIVMAEMISGEPPIAQPERGGAPATAAPRLPRVPVWLARFMRRMIATEPADRPRDGGEVATALAAFRRSLEPRRWRAWAWGTIALCAAAVATWLAMQPARLPPGRLVVAMSDVDNETGDRNLDGMGLLFGAALEQSRRVSLLDRQTLVRALTEHGTRPQAIAEGDATAAARVMAAQLVLVPSLRRVPGGVELGVNVVDVARKRSIYAAREIAATQESLYGAVDRVAQRVRMAIAEEPGEAPRRPVAVAEFAPAHPEALRLYAEGERFAAHYEYGEAKARWEQAIAVEPSFPLPRLSLLQGTLGIFAAVDLEPRVAREHARALRRDLARLPDGVRDWAEAVIVRVEDGFANHTEYVAALDRAIAARPEQPAPYVAAANALLFRRGDAAAARPYVDRAIQLAPLAGLGDVIDYLLLTNRLDDAVAEARKWTEKAPGITAYLNLASVHSARGETSDALAALRVIGERWPETGLQVFEPVYVDADRIEELDDHVARTGQAPSPLGLAMRGRVRLGLETLDRGRDAPQDDFTFFGLSRDANTAAAAVLLARGDRDAVERAVAEAMRTAGPRPIHAWLLAEAGSMRLARQFSGRITDRMLEYRIVRALCDWRAGDPDAALAEFGAIASPAAEFHRGEILAEMGRHQEAVAAYRRYRQLRHGDMSTPAADLDHWFLPRSLYLEAVSLDALGDRGEARRVLARLLRLWAGADPELPLLADARALARRLE